PERPAPTSSRHAVKTAPSIRTDNTWKATRRFVTWKSARPTIPSQRHPRAAKASRAGRARVLRLWPAGRRERIDRYAERYAGGVRAVAEGIGRRTRRFM